MPDTIETSQDLQKFYLVDQYINAKTGALVEVPIDLSTAIIVSIKFVPKVGTAKIKTLTPDPDQVANKGYASRTLANDDLAAGIYHCQITYEDSGLLFHYSEIFLLSVERKL